MPGRKCTVCQHVDSLDINHALVVQGTAKRRIAAHYDLSEQAVRRHVAHIPELLIQSQRAQEIADADVILDKLVELEDAARVALRATKESQEWRTYLAAIAELREQVKLLAQVSGKLQEIQINNTHQVNVLIAPVAQQAIVGALEPYPEAKLAVAKVLGELEASRAA